MRHTAVLLFLGLFAVACGSSDDPGASGVDPTLPAPDPTVPVSSAADPAIPDSALGAEPYPIATLEITVTHPDAASLGYTLSCLGDTATLIGDAPVDAERACIALGEPDVRTRLVEGVPVDQMCTEIYGGPDVATMVGTLDDDAVDATIDRANGCGIDDWDRLLAEILPPAVGPTDPAS